MLQPLLLLFWLAGPVRLAFGQHGPLCDNTGDWQGIAGRWMPSDCPRSRHTRLSGAPQSTTQHPPSPDDPDSAPTSPHITKHHKTHLHLQWLSQA